jgi:hypothetical protein
VGSCLRSKPLRQFWHQNLDIKYCKVWLRHPCINMGYSQTNRQHGGCINILQFFKIKKARQIMRRVEYIWGQIIFLLTSKNKRLLRYKSDVYALLSSYTKKNVGKSKALYFVDGTYYKTFVILIIKRLYFGCYKIW